MAIANPRIHIICGICGSKDDMTYLIDNTGICRADGVEVPGVEITCKNCSSVTGLDYVMKEKPEIIYEEPMGKMQSYNP